METWRPDDLALIIDGIFEINARLGEISTLLSEIRELLEEDDGRTDEEED